MLMEVSGMEVSSVLVRPQGVEKLPFCLRGNLFCVEKVKGVTTTNNPSLYYGHRELLQNEIPSDGFTLTFCPSFESRLSIQTQLRLHFGDTEV